jgi:hypothetical protein
MRERGAEHGSPLVFLPSRPEGVRVAFADTPWKKGRLDV